MFSPQITGRVIFGGKGPDFTPIQESLKFATTTQGGFADGSFQVNGDRRRDFPYLGLVRLTIGPQIIYEGQIEDQELQVTDGSIVTQITVLGLKRILDENTVRRIWSLRGISWQEIPGGEGQSAGATATKTSNITISTGAFDLTDLTKYGVQASGNGQIIADKAGNYGQIVFLGTSVRRLLASVAFAGTNTGAGKVVGSVLYTTDGTTWSEQTYTANGTVNLDFAENVIAIRLGARNASGGNLTPTAADTIAFTNIRLLGADSSGATLSEDDGTNGGFYGGTILRDLLKLATGLTVGIIEDGSDFTIQALDRASRNTLTSVVQEVAGYYTREWGVWEDARFFWVTKDMTTPSWVIRSTECKEIDLRGTLDDTAQTVIVQYTDAATGLDTEQSATSTAQSNPYVKQQRTKAMLVQPGFVMTANTALQWAQTLASELCQFVPQTGTVTLYANQQVRRPGGGPGLAAMIRAGDNILLPDLPKADIMASGRDGETLFHIVSTELDAEQGTMTLELESRSTRTDVLLARLGAVTKTITG